MLFDLMIEYVGYGFNKSHVTAVGLITYKMAYLKANFPAKFEDALKKID
jgi:DNA polymerase-3 subunit alpha